METAKRCLSSATVNFRAWKGAGEGGFDLCSSRACIEVGGTSLAGTIDTR